MRARAQLIGLGLVVLAAWLIGSCAKSPMDVLIPNQPPTVAISAGPIRDSVDVFIVTINWNASDSDGQVVRFAFAIDDTLSPGAWFQTAAYEVTLLLTAPDSAGVDSIRIGLSNAFFERYRFRGAHTFYLKAIDDDGAVSATAAISFTSETFAPETQILVPSPSGVVDLGPTFTVTWQGTDLDGTENPVGYSHRLVRVQNVIALTPAQMESTLFDPRSPGEPWSPFEPRTSKLLPNLETPAEYLFGVVAIDQAGAVEPRLRTSQVPGPTNILRIRASLSGGRPRLRVCGSVKCVDFPESDERRLTFQVPANTNLTFTWTGDGVSYGGTIAGYSHGLDLLDPFAEDPQDPRWSPESAAITRVVLRFDLPPGALGEEHLFYVRARDNVGGTTIATIILIVVPLTGERDVLLVDDFSGDFRGQAPSDCVTSLPPCATSPPPCINQTADVPQDECHDEFLLEAVERGLAALGRKDWVVDLYNPLDSQSGNVIQREVVIDSTSNNYWVYTGPVTLVNLARYKLVVWNVKSETNCQLRFMNREGNDNFLAAFIEAGGDVWIEGTGGFSRTRDRDSGLSPFGFLPGEFLYRFLKIESIFENVDCRNGCIRPSGQDAQQRRRHGFEKAYSHTTAMDEGYPDSLHVTRPPFADHTQGVPSCEGMVVPLGLDINPRLRLFGGRLDTLYFYLSNGVVHLFQPSYMDHAACALRYSGPGQGRLMVFGFPLYYVPEQADEIVVSSLRWFLEP